MDSEVDLSGLILIEEGKTYLAKLAKQYLISRNIFDHKGIFYGEIGYWKNRIVFPIWDDGKIIFAIGRSFASVDPKYKFPIGLKKSDFLYIYSKSPDRIILVESIFCAMSIQGGTAILGKYLSDVQFYKILSMLKPNMELWIALDRDAIPNAINICWRFLPYCSGRLKLIMLPEKKDLSDLRGDLGGSDIYNITEPALISIARSIPISLALSNLDNLRHLQV